MWRMFTQLYPLSRHWFQPPRTRSCWLLTPVLPVPFIPVYLFQLTFLSTVYSQPQLNTSDTTHNNHHKSHHQMCLLTWPSSLPTRSAASHSITLRSTAHPGDCDWNQWTEAPELTEINEERIHRRSRRLRGKLTCQWGGNSFLSD